MKMSVDALAMETYVPALRTLSELLDKGVEHSKAKGTDAAALLKERLAPDMFPLALQVQLACHHAKDGTARATGQEPPKLDTSELPFTELKALIEQTIQALSSTTAKAFDGAEDRRIELQLQGSRVLETDGLQFLWRWSIPHFYFHVVTAYDILRHTAAKNMPIPHLFVRAGAYLFRLSSCFGISKTAAAGLRGQPQSLAGS
jgi:uncharacterized protein